MAYIFDGPNKLIVLTPGTTVVGVRDILSRWAEWVTESDNAKYLPAFNQVGGNDIDTGVGSSIPIYAFLLNGWRIRPQESNHTLQVNDGILLVDGGGDPFVNTLGSFVVRINFQQPVQAITVSTGGGSAPTVTEVRDAVWSADLSSYVPGSAGDRVEALPTAAQVATAVWDEPFAPHLGAGSTGLLLSQINANTGATALSVVTIGSQVNLMLKYDKNRTKIDTAAKTLIVYDNDGVTPIQVFNLRDANGLPSIVESYERIPTL